MKKIMLILGKILCVLQLLASVLLLLSLNSLQMLPGEQLVVVGVILACLTIVTSLLIRSKKGKNKVFGIFLSVVLLFSLSVGAAYIEKTRDAFENISGGSEVVHIGIYVRSDNLTDYNANAKDFRYGILQDMDKESIDSVIEQMTDFFNQAPVLQSYQELPELVDALLNGQIDAIILNQAYLDMLQELAGYGDLLDRICETELKQVEIQVEMKEEPPVQEETPTTDVLKPFCVYISGIDAKGSASVRSRSDVNILAMINPETRQIALVSTPRDYFVPLSISNGVPDKLTHAGVYGIQVSKDTMAMLYDVEPDYYFRVNFSGFVKIIDALGSVTVYSEYAFKADKGRYDIQKGENELNGRAALAFCRERYMVSGGDRQRGKNQMAVVQGVVKKMLSPALLQNYTSVLDALKGSFETDIPSSLIGKLVTQQLKNRGSWNIVTCSADGKGDYQVPYSMSMNAYVMLPDYETVDRAKELMQKVYNGEILEKQ